MKNEDLKVLLPETSLLVNGEEIEVSPFPFAKLTRVVGILGKIGVSFYAVAESIKMHDGEMIITGDTILATANLFEQYFDDVVDLMAIYCRKDRTFFLTDEFNVEDGIKIILNIFAMHKSFFTQTVKPTMSALPGQK